MFTNVFIHAFCDRVSHYPVTLNLTPLQTLRMLITAITNANLQLINPLSSNLIPSHHVYSAPCVTVVSRTHTSVGYGGGGGGGDGCGGGGGGDG